MDSILNVTKKMLGIEPDYTEFDTSIITSINSAFMSLNQLGVGPATVFKVVDDTTVWDDFVGSNPVNIEGIREYVYLKVRMVFDPPTVGAVVESYNRLISELEFRLTVQAESLSMEDV